MPNFFKKKNKSYGVSSKENAAPLGTVRPLSAAFGTDNILHLDEDDAGKKKTKIRDRGTSKSAKSNNSRSRSTSVPARPISTSFGTHFLPQEHIVEPKRSQSPGAQRKKSTGNAPLQRQKRGGSALASEEYLPQQNVNFQAFKIEEENRSRSVAPKSTVIRYTEKNSVAAGDLWSNALTDNGHLDPYDTVYGTGLHGVHEKSAGLTIASNEDITDAPFPREPSIRVPTNTYYKDRKFSTFAPENELDLSKTDRRHSTAVNGDHAVAVNHIYDEPENVKRNSLKSSTHHYESPSNHYASANLDSSIIKKAPAPPRRSTSLQFEDVPIPSEPYQPMGTFLTPAHSKQRSFENFEGSIVHVTHESTKVPMVLEDATDPGNKVKRNSLPQNVKDNNTKFVRDDTFSDDEEQFTDLHNDLHTRENIVQDPKINPDNSVNKMLDNLNNQEVDMSVKKPEVKIDDISLNLENSQNVAQNASPVPKQNVSSFKADDRLHDHLNELLERQNKMNVNFVDKENILPDKVEEISEMSHPGSDYTMKDMEIADHMESEERKAHHNKKSLDTSWNLQSAKVSPNFCLEINKISPSISETTDLERKNFEASESKTNVFDFEGSEKNISATVNNDLDISQNESEFKSSVQSEKRESNEMDTVSVLAMVKSINGKGLQIPSKFSSANSQSTIANNLVEVSDHKNENLIDNSSETKRMSSINDTSKDIESKSDDCYSQGLFPVSQTKLSVDKRVPDDNYVLQQNHSTNDSSDNSVTATLNHVKPSVPYKPAKLSALRTTPELSRSDTELAKPDPLLPKPFLSKPLKFVPSKLGRDKNVSENKPDIKGLPVIAKTKGSYVSQHISKFSVLSKDNPSNKVSGKSSSDIANLKTEPNKINTVHKPQLPVKPHEPVKVFIKTDDSASNQKVIASSESSYISQQKFPTPNPFKAFSSASKTMSSEDSVKNDESVSFLDSLKKRNSIKKETTLSIPNNNKETIADGKNIKSTNVEVRESNEEKVDVTQFLNELKHTSCRESFRKKTKSESESKDFNEPEKSKKAGVMNLLLSPLSDKKNISSEHVDKKLDCDHFDKEHSNGPCKENQLEESKNEKPLSKKEALFKEACELPETNIDSDGDLQLDANSQPPTNNDHHTFSALKNIDTLSHREHSGLSKSVLSPRQLKRSKGKFSHSKRSNSGGEDRPVYVRRRSSTLSTESSGIEEYDVETVHSQLNSNKQNDQVISENVDEMKAVSEENSKVNLLSTSLQSIGSEHSAFSPVCSGDEAENSSEEVIDLVPTEFQNLQHENSYEKRNNETRTESLSLQESPRVQITHEIEQAPTPPPRRNRDKRRSRNLDSSLNSDRSSLHSSSQSSGISSNTKELAMINQKSNSSFIPVDDGDVCIGQENEERTESEQGVCMPWDNNPWESPEGVKFCSDDIPDPILVNGEQDVNDYENNIEHQCIEVENTYPSIDDIPSPKSISPSVRNANLSYLVLNKSDVADYLETNEPYHADSIKSGSDVFNLANDGNLETCIPKLDLNKLHENDPPSPLEAKEAVSKIFDDTVRYSSREQNVTNTGPHNSDKHGDENEINYSFKFERNMKTIRSPSSVHERAIDVQYLENSSEGSAPSMYSERAIDIQDLDTSGKPMSISKHYEERGVDIEGLPQSGFIRSPVSHHKKTRRTSKLSDTSSQYTDQSKSFSPNQSKAGATIWSPSDKKSQNDLISQSSPLDKSSVVSSHKGYMSPKSTQNFFEEISEFSGLGSKTGDLSNVKLPGLRLNPTAGVARGPMKGSEHLHPALERSLRTTAIASRIPGTDKSGHGRIHPGISMDTELMVLVEDDYMTPRPGYNHAVMQNKDVPEPWSLDMMHNWNAAQQKGSAPVNTVDNKTLSQQQNNIVMSEVSSNTTTTEQKWQSRPIDQWENEDTVDWAEAMGFDELADALHGTGICGEQLLMVQDHILIDLGIINAELRYQILEEISKLKEQPDAAVPLWSLKQASVRRKNLEASSNAIKSRLSNLQQLNNRQEHQIESYLEELKEQQKQTEILLHSPPPPSESSSHQQKNSNPLSPGNDNRKVLLTRMSSINTDVSAVLPALSMTDSEVSMAKVPHKPLPQWNNNDVLQWLAASGLYIFSDKFYTHKVTGRDLSEISMQFLDKIGIESLEDREVLLSKLYELQHPGEPSLEEILKTKSDSGSGAQKRYPSNEPSLKSPSSRSSSTGSAKRPAVMMGTRMVSKDSRESPWTPASARKSSSLSVEDQELAEKNVLIWHHLGGTTTSSYVSIGEDSTCYDAIQKLLLQQRVIDDPNLFFLVDKDSSGREIEVAKFECMSELQHKWQNPMAHKLQLKQKSGLQIKVTYKAGEHEPRTKSFPVATCSSYSEILLVACRKFKIGQHGHFVLLELYKDSGNVHQIPVKKNISELLSDTFLLCEKNAVRQAQKLAMWLKERRNSVCSQTSSNLSDTASQATVTSSRADQYQGLEAQMEALDGNAYKVDSEEDDDDISITENNIDNSSSYPLYYPANKSNVGKFHSKSSYDLLSTGNLEGNSSLEAKHKHFRSMDGFDSWSSGHVVDVSSGGPRAKRRVLSAGNDLERVGVHTPKALELLQELALLKESLRERDINIMDLRKENKELQDKNHEMVFDQNRLKNLEEIFQEKQASWQTESEELQTELHKLQQEKLEKEPELKIQFLEEEIEKSRSNIWKQEEDISGIRTEIEEHANGDSPQPKVVEYLQSQLSQGETLLLTLKQEHGDLLLDLENTKKKLQLKQVSSTLDLYSLIGSDKPPCLHALELASRNGSYGLIIGRDKEKRLMVRHTEEGRPILKGDRLIEVNGRLVAKMEDEEIANFLKYAKEKSGCLNLVVLREFDQMKNEISKEEHEALKEDLSLALMELESLQQDNKDFTRDVETLKRNLKNMTSERNELEKELKSAKPEENGNGVVENGVDTVSFAEASPHKRLQLMLDTLNAGKPQAQAVTSSQLRRGASRRGLDWFNTLVSVDRLDQVLAYDELDEKLPLYESMKIAPKDDVLQALKDTILETHQQKAYLDKLMALVIDHAPYLLKSVDSSMGLEDDLLSIKSRTEERC